MINEHSGDDQDLDPDRTPVQRAIDAHRHSTRQPNDLTPDERQLVEDTLPWLDAVRDAAQLAIAGPPSEPDTGVGPPVPVRPDDPVALMLGLVPDPDVLVNGRKLADARKRARLNLGQLVDRLRARGWEVTAPVALEWEFGQLALPPALITAIAEELAVDDDSLLATAPTRREQRDLFDDQRIRAYLADWAAEAGVEPEWLRDRASATLAAAAHRNRTSGSVEALLDVLRTLRSIPDFLE